MYNKYRYVSWALLCIFGLLFACYLEDTSILEKEWGQLAAESKKHHQRFCLLQHQTDSIWDHLTLQLEKGMPTSIPPTDRKVFLNSRNADHIRMFMSFKSLSPELQKMVHTTGSADSLLAIQVRLLQQEMTALDTKKTALLSKIETKDAALSRRFTDSLRVIASLPCL